MKTIEIIDAIKSGTFDGSKILPLEISPHEIINISDFKILKELSENLSYFEVLTKTETWEKNEDRQFILGSMGRLISFLREIKNAECYCIKYKFIATYPELEQSKGMIQILEKSGDYLSRVYKCKCISCGIKWEVYYQEQRFGHSYHWS